MDNCLFCKIVAGSTPSYTVYEDEQTKAFLDIFPSTSGHVVVILKKHGWAIGEYTPEELGNLMATVQKVVAALTVAFQTEVFTIGMNHKEENGVHHLHMHVLPRFLDDGGSVIQSIVEREGKDSLTEIAEKIKKEIR